MCCLRFEWFLDRLCGARPRNENKESESETKWRKVKTKNSMINERKSRIIIRRKQWIRWIRIKDEMETEGKADIFFGSIELKERSKMKDNFKLIEKNEANV